MVQLVGGNFQDAEGNVLAGGKLTLRLNQDASVNDSQIAAGIEVDVYLDAFGDAIISPGQFVWGNDVLSPINTYYRVTGYTANGQLAWGPNNQQIMGSGIFDLGTWVPNIVISWFPTPQSLALEVNGVPLSSQSLQNIVNGPNVTITDIGRGVIEISSTRLSAFFYTIDGGGSAIVPGAKGQLNVPVNCTITGWVLTADQVGSAVVDVLTSTYAAFPTTSSIAGSDKPTLATAQKNENLSVFAWDTSLTAGQQLQFNVDSASTVTRLNLTLLVTVP
jgi:hypothetical protein